MLLSKFLPLLLTISNPAASRPAGAYNHNASLALGNITTPANTSSLRKGLLWKNGSSEEVAVVAKGLPYDMLHNEEGHQLDTMGWNTRYRRICAKEYMGAFSRWSASLPMEWWREKYHHNITSACRDYYHMVLADFAGNAIVKWECYEYDQWTADVFREHFPHTLAGAGWLHLQFLTPVGVMLRRMENVILSLRDESRYLQNNLPVRCFRSGVGFNGLPIIKGSEEGFGKRRRCKGNKKCKAMDAEWNRKQLPKITPRQPSPGDSPGDEVI